MRATAIGATIPNVKPPTSPVQPKRLVRGESKPKAKIVPVRLPADLVAAIDAFAATAVPPLPASSAMRLLMRAGLAANNRKPLDLRGAGFKEGWASGHAEALEAHQRALHAAKAQLARTRAA